MHLSSEDVNCLCKAIPWTLQLEALGYVRSLQGAAGAASHPVRAPGEAGQLSSPVWQYGTCWGGEMKGISHEEMDDPVILLKKAMWSQAIC